MCFYSKYNLKCMELMNTKKLLSNQIKVKTLCKNKKKEVDLFNQCDYHLKRKIEKSH